MTTAQPSLPRLSRLLLAVTLTLFALAMLLTPAHLQTLLIGITPEYTRRARPGQVVTYTHTLANHTATTATIALVTTSAHGWPVALSVPATSTGTLQFPLRLSAYSTATFHLRLTVPATAGHTIEQTTITATALLSPALRHVAVNTTIVGYHAYLPVVVRHYPPTPYTPTLDPIDNSDQDNAYTITWDPVPLAETYTLEEATSSDFSDARIIYQGISRAWTVPSPGHTPGAYHYRLRATNDWGHSAWSARQTITVPPLFVGLRLRWDGEGYIRYDTPFDVGHHRERIVETLVAEDNVRIRAYNWYDPNPDNWNDSTWTSNYNPTTCDFLASTRDRSSNWKFADPWIMPTSWHPFRTQSFPIDGHPFIVTGPHQGYTAFGKQVEYWKMTNRESILFWDASGAHQQYLHPGDLILHYDTGPSRLMLYRNVTRSVYEDGRYLGTIQYITQLTAANTFPSTNASLQHRPRKTQTHTSPLEDHLKPH
jgi:hypothetical protein